MTLAQSTTHLSCFIEAIALAKHSKFESRDDLKNLLQQKGYEEMIAFDTADELALQLPIASKGGLLEIRLIYRIIFYGLKVIILLWQFINLDR